MQKYWKDQNSSWKEVHTYFRILQDSSLDGIDSPRPLEPFKILHKEQDIITAFAINQVSDCSIMTLCCVWASDPFCLLKTNVQ